MFRWGGGAARAGAPQERTPAPRPTRRSSLPSARPQASTAAAHSLGAAETGSPGRLGGAGGRTEALCARASYHRAASARPAAAGSGVRGRGRGAAACSPFCEFFFFFIIHENGAERSRNTDGTALPPHLLGVEEEAVVCSQVCSLGKKVLLLLCK